VAALTKENDSKVATLTKECEQRVS
jgi:hypothetical protein